MGVRRRGSKCTADREMALDCFARGGKLEVSFEDAKFDVQGIWQEKRTDIPTNKINRCLLPSFLASSSFTPASSSSLAGVGSVLELRAFVATGSGCASPSSRLRLFFVVSTAPSQAAFEALTRRSSPSVSLAASPTTSAGA